MPAGKFSRLELQAQRDSIDVALASQAYDHQTIRQALDAYAKTLEAMAEENPIPDYITALRRRAGRARELAKDFR